MNFETFQAALEKVKYFKADEDYAAFDKLIESITGTEDIQYLNCLLDAICVDDDYGPYEGLYNAIWRFPIETTATRLAQYLPTLQLRMGHAPFQVWRFYIPASQTEEATAAFLKTAGEWTEAEREITMPILEKWCLQSARDEEAWAPIYKKLGGKLPKRPPVDPVPEEYGWSPELQERLAVWRALPAGKNNEKVFWFGGHETHTEEWITDIPHIIEALALRQGEKWRDIMVWLNPFSFFAQNLYPLFIEELSKTPMGIRNRALSNIKKARKPYYENVCKRLAEEYGITIENPNWPKG